MIAPTRRAGLALALLLPLACAPEDVVPCSTTAPPAAAASVDDGASPGEIASRFLDAVQGSDKRAVLALVTARARTAMNGDDGLELDGSSIESFEVGTPAVSDDEAEVPTFVTERGERQERVLLLRREAHGWRVRALRVAFGDGDFTLDLEHAADVMDEVGEQLAEGLEDAFDEAFDEMETAWANGGTPEQIAAARERFDSIRAVDPDEQTWRVDVHGSGRTAREVLAEVLGDSVVGLAEGDFAERLETPVELELVDVSRVQAIERVANAVGLHAVWPAATQMAWSDEEAPLEVGLAAGPRPLPVTFAGPFAVEVATLEERAPNAVGQLGLAVHAIGLPGAVLAFQDEMAEVLRLERVRGTGDAVLIDEDVQYSSAPTIRGDYFGYSIDLDLVNLLSGVPRVETIAGEVRLPVPRHVETLELARGAGDAQVGAWNVEVTDWNEQVQLELSAGERQVDGVQVRLAPRDADGNPLGTLWASSFGWNTELQASVQTPVVAEHVDLKICETELLTFAFALEGLPLERAAEQPERLLELAFEGAVPVAVEVLELTPAADGQWPVRLRLTNASNKDVGSAMIRFRYLDASGAELDDFPHTLSGSYDFDLEALAPLAVAGATVELDSHAAFVPEGTRTIELLPLRLEFPDGTVWEHEEL